MKCPPHLSRMSNLFESGFLRMMCSRLTRRASFSSTSLGSGLEGSPPRTQEHNPSGPPPTDNIRPLVLPHSFDARQSHGPSVPGASFLSKASTVRDLGTHSPGHVSEMRDLPWSRRSDHLADMHHGRHMLANITQQPGSHPHGYAYRPPSAQPSSTMSRETQFTQPRRRLLGQTESIPSFRHQESSRSSALSSQSGASTAATSNSAYRSIEDEGHSYVTLPPISTVTGLSREGHKVEDFVSHEHSKSPGGGPLKYNAQRPHVPAIPFASGMGH